MCRLSSWNAALIVKQGPVINGFALQGIRTASPDREKLRNGGVGLPPAPDAFQPFAQRFSDGVGHGFTGFLSQRVSELMRFWVFDVQGHWIPLVDSLQPFFIITRMLPVSKGHGRLSRGPQGLASP